MLNSVINLEFEYNLNLITRALKSNFHDLMVILKLQSEIYAKKKNILPKSYIFTTCNNLMSNQSAKKLKTSNIMFYQTSLLLKKPITTIKLFLIIQTLTNCYSTLLGSPLRGDASPSGGANVTLCYVT